MRPHAVVVVPPGADDHLSFLEAVEDLQLQALVLELPVEALTVPVLPRTARLDVQGLGAELGQALARVLINQGHDPQAPSIMGVALDKVEAPDVVGSLRPQADAGAVVEP